MLVALLTVAALLTAATADEIPSFVTRGKCANVRIQDNFDLRKYGGRWYITHLIDNPYLPPERCIHSNYEYCDADYGFKVNTAGFSSNDDYLKLQAKLYPTKEFPAAHMLLDSPTVFATPYQVIETDYDTYSCVYACITFSNYKTEFAFVYSRSPQTDGPAAEKCAAVFEANGVQFSKFKTVSHTAECVYRA